MNYSEVLVTNKVLKESVLCFWEINGRISETEGMSLRYLPKGQNLFVFNFGDRISSLDALFSESSEDRFFSIPAIASSHVFQQKGDIELFGISFISDGLFKFIQKPITHSIELPKELQEQCSVLFLRMRKQSFDEKVKLVEQFLMKTMNQKLKNETFTKAYKKINDSSGNISIKELAGNAKVTERQLQRLFKSRLGISPKALCKIVRVNNYLEYILERESDVDWMEFVEAFDYHDQPHLIREVKSISKLSPDKLLKMRDTLHHRLAR